MQKGNTTTASPLVKAPHPLLSKTRKELFTPKPVELKGRFWDLYKHGLTPSACDLFEDCKEQFRLTYNEGWTSTQADEPLEFGTCIHWVLEQVYQSVAKSGRTQIPTPKEIAELLLEYEQYWSKVLVPAPTQQQLEAQQMVYGMAEATLPNYFRRYDGDLTGSYHYKLEGVEKPHKWLQCEETLCYPYKMPDGRIIFMRGKRDLKFLDRKGRRWNVDTKTKGQINEEVIGDTLKTNFQQMWYMFVDWKTEDIVPAGVQLNLYRRPQLRRGKEETADEFLARIKKDVGDEKRYDHYFLRTQMSIEKFDLEVWEKTVLIPQLQTIQLWFDGTIPHYPTHKALVIFKPCTMYRAILDGDFGGLYKRQLVFPELPEATFK